VRDTILPALTRTLLSWLQAFYGRQLSDLSSDAPLWVSLATNGTRGKRLSTRAIEQICQDDSGRARPMFCGIALRALWKTLARRCRRSKRASATRAWQDGALPGGTAS